MRVHAIPRAACAEFILDIHYARRWPSVSYAFGLFEGENLVGVVTYGKPFSSTLQQGVAGSSFAGHVIELNRLCLRDNKHNQASMLVGRSLHLLGGDYIVVSFADTEQGHLGCVYQAANFKYYGLSAKRTDWKVQGMEHLHSQTISDQFRGEVSRIAAIRAKYGANFYYKDRPRKHRYIYVVGSRKFKRSVAEAMRYAEEPYPKAAEWGVL